FAVAISLGSGWLQVFGLLHIDAHIGTAANGERNFINGFERLILAERFAVIAILVGDLFVAMTFFGAGNNGGGLAVGVGFSEGAFDFVDIMTVDDDGIPAKSFDARFVDIGIPAQHGF